MQKEQLILQYLLDNNDWVKSDLICRFLNVSTRTLRTLIKTINTNNPYVLSSSKGYKINNELADEIKLKLNSFNPESNVTSPMRQQHIIKELLLKEEGINFYDLIDELYVSESTLNNDLAQIRNTLDKYNLILSKKKDMISIIGKEKDIRTLMTETIYSEVDEGLLSFDTLIKTFPEFDVVRIKNILLETIMKHRLTIDDFGLIDITLHVCIMLERVIANYRVENTSYIDSIYTEVAKEVFNKLEELMDVRIDSSELINIVPLIELNTKQVLDVNMYLMELRNYVEQEIIDFVDYITSKVYENYSIQLDNNNFKVRFSLHLSKTLRIFNKTAHNPLLKSIKDEYPLVFDVSVYISKLINERYNHIHLNESEISYIALHVGLSIDRNTRLKVNTLLVIPDYYSLKETITNNLLYNFQQFVEIKGIYTSFDDLELNDSIDLVLSTQRG
ncbi:MAG: PRD domain-containing protein [Erysipelotrichaceae bacterium]|nr:PRD domain-containing protein [Erysipelotrichaceae bacterium]